MSEQYRILLVEDDATIRNLTRMHLNMNGLEEVYSVADGESAWKLAKRIHPDAILLDIMLPGVDGLTLLKNFRSELAFQDTVIMLITAKVEDGDIIAGLEAGADDYILKPFSNHVLLARLRGHLRRRSQDGQTVFFGNLCMDGDSRIARLGGVKISLSADEFDTLLLLASNPEKVFTRRQIIDNVKGGDYPSTDRVVDIRMMKLRRKLGDWAEHLVTVRGVGYKVTGL